MNKALLSFSEGARIVGISERSIKSPTWRERLLAAGALVEPSPGRVKIIASRLGEVVASLPAPARRPEPPQLCAGRVKAKTKGEA